MPTYTLLRSVWGHRRLLPQAKSKTKVNVNPEVFWRKTNSSIYIWGYIFNGDFHLDFKIVKRSEGMTSVAKAATMPVHVLRMIALEKHLISAQNWSTWSYYISPSFHTCSYYESSSALWNEVERVERQNNGQQPVILMSLYQ